MKRTLSLAFALALAATVYGCDRDGNKNAGSGATSGSSGSSAGSSSSGSSSGSMGSGSTSGSTQQKKAPASPTTPPSK